MLQGSRNVHVDDSYRHTVQRGCVFKQRSVTLPQCISSSSRRSPFVTIQKQVNLDATPSKLMPPSQKSTFGYAVNLTFDL